MTPLNGCPPQGLPSIGSGWREGLETALTALALLLRDEKTISAYEVHLSGLVPVLSHCLKGGVASDDSKVATRVELFKRAFAESAQQMPADLDARYVVYNATQTVRSTTHTLTYSTSPPTPTHTHSLIPHPHSTASNSVALPSVGLIRKLISVLEAVEKLSVHTYEPPGQVLNLQMLHRRFKLSLERGAGAGSLVDCSGKALKIEPLVSIDGLESFLNGIVSGWCVNSEWVVCE